MTEAETKDNGVAPRVLVIVPAYNEAETIAGVVEQVHVVSADYDVVVVNDGSTDNTAAIARELDGCVLLDLPFNLGIGGAMQTGYKYALRRGYDVAVQCDADGQHPVDAIPYLVRRLREGAGDVVIGSRYVTDTEYTPSFGRRVGKSILSRWVDYLVGGGITDTTSGFRAMNRDAMAVVARSYPEDYPEPEVLVVLHKHGLNVAEVPVRMRPRQGGATSIRPAAALYYMVKVGLATLIDVFRRYER